MTLAQEILASVKNVWGKIMNPTISELREGFELVLTIEKLEGRIVNIVVVWASDRYGVRPIGRLEDSPTNLSVENGSFGTWVRLRVEQEGLRVVPTEDPRRFRLR